MGGIDGIQRQTGPLALPGVAPVRVEEAAPVAVPATERPEGDRNLAGTGRAALLAAAGGLDVYQGSDLSPVGTGGTGGTGGTTPTGGIEVYAQSQDLTQDSLFLKTEATREVEKSQFALGTATVEAAGLVAEIRALAGPISFAQGGELDLLGPEVRQKHFFTHLDRADTALKQVPPNVESLRSLISTAIVMLNPTTDVQQRYYGPKPPGADGLLDKLKALLTKIGYKGDEAKNPGSLYALRGKTIECKARLDTLVDQEAMAARVAAKAVEAQQAQADAQALRATFQAKQAQTASSYSSFERETRAALVALPADPATQEAIALALKLLKGAGDGLKCHEFGQVGKMLTMLRGIMKEAGLPLKALDDMALQIKGTGQAASASWLAGHKASKLGQEAERMKSGYDKALASIAALARP